MKAEDAVRAVDLACHEALSAPTDDMARINLLEALATFKATPVAAFPTTVLDLVTRSHQQADALSDRILSSNNLSDPMIDADIRSLCVTTSALAAALRPSDSITAGEGRQ